ncbi:MAG: inner membrane protein YpjD [Betaproteobacteria bacterium]|nr:cytochrome c biogenesis protein CcsA [Pseudomonadota bacterium]NBO12056.1 inner membrane protein YpjD [Betaproteobacteria bacterium]NBO44296.1 inner membrane protein YpjD [Betaproteobacteria bacterium]NBP09966.1 inner membrane protein YpjD [Betaproteobacteria bacterium]NBP60715.1 inner membrane protein YpjD [Betaproteobacteria bacterium]
MAMASQLPFLAHWQGWLTIAAAASYLIASFLIRRRDPKGLMVLAVALAIHGPVLASQIVALEGLRYGFASALSATLWLALVVLVWEARRSRLEGAASVVAPVAAVTLVLPWFFVGHLFQGPVSVLFVPHLLIGTLAYGVFLLAATLAAFILIQARTLQARHGRLLEDGLFDQLPPLMAMERMLFRYLSIGFVLLTITLISGVLFSEEVFGQAMRFDHKSVLTLLSWAVYGLLLWGHRYRGWRGAAAARATLLAFFVLLLAYVGSRFVLEVILKRVSGA